MAWVFDASIAATWCFDDERTPATEKLFDRLEQDAATVPNLFHLELANVLTQAMRKKPPRISAAKRNAFLATLSQATIVLDDLTAPNAWQETLKLSDKYLLCVYDAAYLELALRLRVDLATLDRELRVAAASAGVTVIP